MIEAGAEATRAGSVRRAGLGPRRAIGVLVCAAVAGLAIGVAVHFLLRGSHPATAGAPAAIVSAPKAPDGLHGQATWAAGQAAAPAIRTLRDQTGQRFALSSLRGHTVVIAFFDSHCNQACPLEGRAIAAAERSLPAGEQPVNVLVSVNPRDTPASVRAAARRWGLTGSGGWHWLMGTHAELARVWKAYRIFVAPPRGGDIAHTEAIYVVDRRGDQRSGYLYPFAPRFVGADLRFLARQTG